MSRSLSDELTGIEDDCGWVSGSSSWSCLSTSHHTGQSHRLPGADNTLKLLPGTPPASRVYCSLRQHVPVTGVTELTAAAARGSCTGSLQCKRKVNPALQAAAVAAAAAQHVRSSSTITSAAAAMMKYTANALAKSTQGSSPQQQHLEQQHRHQQGWSQPQQWQRIEQQQFHHQQHQHQLHAQQRQQQQCNHWRQHVTRQVAQNNGSSSSSRAAGRSLGLHPPEIQATVLQQQKLSSSHLHQQKLKSLPSPANSLPQADDVTAGKTEHALNAAASPAGSVAATCGSSGGVVPAATVVAFNLLDDATGNMSGTEALAHQQRHTNFYSNNSSHSSSDTSSSNSDGGSVGGQYVAPRRRSRLSSNSSSSGCAGSSNSSSSGCVCATQIKQSLSPYSSSCGGSQAAASGDDHIKCSSSGSGSLRDVRPAAVPAAGVDALQSVRRLPSLRQKIQGTVSTADDVIAAAAASPMRYRAPSSSSSVQSQSAATTPVVTPAVVVTTSLGANLKSSSVGCTPAHITAHDRGSDRGGESAVTGPQGSGYVHSTQGSSSREVCLVDRGSLLQPDLESRPHHSRTLHHFCSSGSGSNSTVQSLSGTRDQHTLLDAAGTGFVPAEAVCSCEHVACGGGDMLMMSHPDSNTQGKPGCQNDRAGQPQAAAAEGAAAADGVIDSSANQPDTDSESELCAGTPSVQNMKHTESSSAVAAVGSVALTPAISSQYNSHEHHGTATAAGAAQELPSGGQQQQQQAGASNAPAKSAAPEDFASKAGTSAQQQLHPVITAGIPYTVVTSLQGAAAVHPTPRTALRSQLQKLERQAAQMMSVVGGGGDDGVDGACGDNVVEHAVRCSLEPPAMNAAAAADAVAATPVVVDGGGTPTTWRIPTCCLCSNTSAT